MLMLPPNETALPNCLEFQLVIFKLGLCLLKMLPIYFFIFLFLRAISRPQRSPCTTWQKDYTPFC